MKRLKRFNEGVKYETTEVLWDIWEVTDAIKMNEKTFNDIKTFVSKWGARCVKVDEYLFRVYWHHESNQSEISLVIFESEDEWFWVSKEEYIGGKEEWEEDKYYRCDQLGGLKEKIEEIFKDVKPINNPQEFLKKVNLTEEEAGEVPGEEAPEEEMEEEGALESFSAFFKKGTAKKINESKRNSRRK